MAPCPLHDGGISNALLGTAENPLPSSSALDGPMWLGVSIDGTPEMRPLSLLSATAQKKKLKKNTKTYAKIEDFAATADTRDRLSFAHTLAAHRIASKLPWPST
jgi:hypothetical protein